MKHRTLLWLWIFCFCSVTGAHHKVFAQDSLPPSHGESLLQYVKGIEGKSPEGRRQYIKQKLKEFGVSFSTMPFDTILSRGEMNDTIHGENIIARLGSGKKKIVLGAHCDAFPGAPGANDNGSGVAIVLEMIRTLKENKWHHSVDFCFFDQEEAGLIGSAVYVKRYDTSFTHLAMINLDVEGTGNEIYVGPVGGRDDSLVMKYVHQARGKTKFAYEENKIYPGSDQESFANAKLENISISVVPKGDVKKLVKWTMSGFMPIKIKEDMPEVLKVMHTPNDKSEYVSPKALTMSYEFTKTTLLLLDAGER